MRMQFRPYRKSVFLFLLISFFLWNCGDQKKESTAPVISKKISVQNIAKSEKGSDTPQVEDSAKNLDSQSTTEEETVAKRIYNPKERINPFTPLFRAEAEEASADQIEKSKRKKRLPQTPLERISLNQLKLVAVIRASSGNKALVEDSSGKGYIIKNGTYIGLNSGIVTQINADSLIVEEELENLLGELVLQNTEIKLQKTAGE